MSTYKTAYVVATNTGNEIGLDVYSIVVKE